jgi:phage pi2 protein 07
MMLSVALVIRHDRIRENVEISGRGLDFYPDDRGNVFL